MYHMDFKYNKLLFYKRICYFVIPSKLDEKKVTVHPNAIDYLTLHWLCAAHLLILPTTIHHIYSEESEN